MVAQVNMRGKPIGPGKPVLTLGKFVWSYQVKLPKDLLIYSTGSTLDFSVKVKVEKCFG